MARLPCCILLAALAGVEAAPAATLQQWREGLDQIERELVAIHPNPFSKVGELTFRRQTQALREALSRLSEAERVVQLMRLVASIGDGHTRVELKSSEYALWYPIRLYEFADGYYVTAAHESVAELAGARVLTIAGQPVETVADDARSLFGADNEFDAKERLYALHNAVLMRGLGYADKNGTLALTVQMANGPRKEVVLSPSQATDETGSEGFPVFHWTYPSEVYGVPIGDSSEWISAYGSLRSSAFRTADAARPPFLQQRFHFTRRAIPDANAYYLQINQVNRESMVDFVSQSLEEVDHLRPQHLILDLRYNFGGDGSTVTAMIHEFVRRQDAPPWTNLYVLTGRKTFSAGVMALDALVDHANPTLIGEPAGAPFNSHGDADARPFPALGLDVSISALWHQLSDSNDLRSYVPVDVPRMPHFADYISGRDPAVDDILDEDVEMRSIAEVARAEGGAVARAVLHQRNEEFRKVGWWHPPAEPTLRKACRDLLAAGRHEDGLQTCLLNTEIHPGDWRPWYNLAQAYRAVGKPELRYSPYRCVVELAPTNWNTPSILQLFRDNDLEPGLPKGCPVDR